MSWFDSQFMTQSFTQFITLMNKLAHDEIPCLLIVTILSHCPVVVCSIWQSQQVIIYVIMISRLVMRPLILQDEVCPWIVPLKVVISLARRKSLFSLDSFGQQ